MTAYDPDNPSPVIDTVRDWMEENDISIGTMAMRAGTLISTVRALLDGGVEITHEVTRALAQATNIPAEFWLDREKLHRKKIGDTREIY
jgi:plasmid maintenance system antidote protein VapI